LDEKDEELLYIYFLVLLPVLLPLIFVPFLFQIGKGSQFSYR